MIRDVTIVGGGITGIAAAYRLAHSEPTLKVALIEASSRLGGKIGTETARGYAVEFGPDCFLSRKIPGIALCEELGIAERLIARNPDHKKSFILRNGRLHRIPEGLTGLIPPNLESIAESTLLSGDAKSRFGREIGIPPEPEGEDESVASFMIRRFGSETFENLIEPLAGGIFAGRAEELSLAATFPQLRKLEIEYGSVTRGLNKMRGADGEVAVDRHPPFVSFAGGMQVLVDSLSDELTGAEIRLGSAAVRIDRTGEKYSVRFGGSEGEDSIESHALLLATPFPVSAQLTRSIDAGLAEALGAIPYASTALVNLAFDEAMMPPLDGYGYIVPRVEGRDVLACTWSSRKWEKRSPAGKVLLRLYIGRFGGIDVSSRSDAELVTMARTELRESLGVIDEPLFTRTTRHQLGIPQYLMGHMRRRSKIESHILTHPGFYIAGAALDGVGIPDCIASAETAVAQIRNYLS